MSTRAPLFLRDGTILGEAIADGRTIYDSAAAEACLAAWSTVTCDDLEGTSTRTACQATLQGTLADGSHCSASVQCLPGSFCTIPAGVGLALCARTCVPGGTLCNDDTHCTDGQICDTTMPTSASRGSCVTPTPPGEVMQPCGTNHRCQSGLYCSTVGQNPVCVVPAASGETCVGNDYTSCAAGLGCVSYVSQTQTMMQTACLPLAARGQPCQFDLQCGGTFSPMFCDPTSHLCVDIPDQHPCSVVPRLPNGCNLASSYCNTPAETPFCVPLSRLGGRCAGDEQCGLFTGLICVSNTCVSSNCLTP